MSSQRNGHTQRDRLYDDALVEGIRKLLPKRGLPQASGDRRVRWTDRMLAVVAMLMGWQEGSTLGERFHSARAITAAMYCDRLRPGRTYDGFMRVLQTAGDVLDRMVRHLRHLSKTLAGDRWRWRRWVVFAVDGTRIDCPRTADNEEAFGCSGRPGTTPQMLLTVLYHLGLGLPWSWRYGGSDASERGHLRTMVAELPKRSLLLMDAGFTGFDLLTGVMASGHDFIVRVGKNVTLIRDLDCVYEIRKGMVHIWPQNRRGSAPMALRLVKVGRGKKTVYLLTSVLYESALPDSDVGMLYARRWGVEVMFRSLKQTMGNRKMLSRAPHYAQTELDWAIVGLWALGHMTISQLPANRRHTLRWSTAKALKAVRRAMRTRNSRRRRKNFQRRLRLATVGNNIRHGDKRARYWPHPKKLSPPGPPKIRIATPSEVASAKRIAEANHAA